MSEQLNTKIERNSNPRKISVQDKMDTRDCARLLDYYRMRVGKLFIFYDKSKSKRIFENSIVLLLIK